MLRRPGRKQEPAEYREKAVSRSPKVEPGCRRSNGRERQGGALLPDGGAPESGLMDARSCEAMLQASELQ